MIDEGRNRSDREALADRLELERLGTRSALVDTATDLAAALAAIDRAIAQAKTCREVLALRLDNLTRGGR